MNGNSVIGDLYKIKGSSREVSLQSVDSTPEVVGRIYSLDWVNKLSSDYKNSRRLIKIDWVKSFELHGKSESWKKDILKIKEKEVYNLKRKINFPTGESFKEALEMGDESIYHDYIAYLEDEVDAIKALKKSPARKTTKKKDVEPLTPSGDE